MAPLPPRSGLFEALGDASGKVGDARASRASIEREVPSNGTKLHSGIEIVPLEVTIEPKSRVSYLLKERSRIPASRSFRWKQRTAKISQTGPSDRPDARSSRARLQRTAGEFCSEALCDARLRLASTSLSVSYAVRAVSSPPTASGGREAAGLCHQVALSASNVETQ